MGPTVLCTWCCRDQLATWESELTAREQQLSQREVDVERREREVGDREREVDRREVELVRRQRVISSRLLERERKLKGIYMYLNNFMYIVFYLFIRLRCFVLYLYEWPFSL